MFRTSVCWLCPGATKPTFMSVQLVCAGWGSEFMSWPTPSVFMKVTRAPRVTTMAFGDAPAAESVIVVVAVGPPGGGGLGLGVGAGAGAGVGASGLLSPPHETTASDEPMVRVRAARLAAQMERGMSSTSGNRDCGSHSLPRG